MRQDPDPTTVSERDSLGQYLDYQRETILLKTDGLTKEQLAQQLPSSGLTLAGRSTTWPWSRNHGPRRTSSGSSRARTSRASTGKPTRTTSSGPHWTRNPTGCAAAPGRLQPDPAGGYRGRRQPGHALGPAAVGGKPFTLRWMIMHLIEETARPPAHADLLREAIDGTAGVARPVSSQGNRPPDQAGIVRAAPASGQPAPRLPARWCSSWRWLRPSPTTPRRAGGSPPASSSAPAPGDRARLVTSRTGTGGDRGSRTRSSAARRTTRTPRPGPGGRRSRSRSPGAEGDTLRILPQFRLYGTTRQPRLSSSAAAASSRSALSRPRRSPRLPGPGLALRRRPGAGGPGRPGLAAATATRSRR